VSDPIPSSSEPSKTNPPPRAFTQGLGLVFQIVGCTLFLLFMFVCCGSTLLNKDFATHSNLTRIAWHGYSAQRALTISLFGGVFFGLALAGIGLGMQAEHRAATVFAVLLTGFATGFWLVHLLVASLGAQSVLFSTIALVLMISFAFLFVLAVAAALECRRNPPEPGHEVLPAGYQVPYSHLHQEPPEIRFAAELEQRRQRLAVQQKELEALEQRLKHKFDEDSSR